MNMLRRVANYVAKKVGEIAAPVAGVSAMVLSGSAAATGPDFSGILTNLDATTVTTAILAACAIIAGVGFAKWGGKKLAKFFG